MRAGKNIIVWLVAIVLLTSLMNMFGEGSARATAENLAFSDFMKDVEGKRISEVTITGAEISGSYWTGTSSIPMRRRIRRWLKRCATAASR